MGEVKISITIQHCPFNEERAKNVRKIIASLGKDVIQNKLAGFDIVQDWKEKGKEHLWSISKKSWLNALKYDSTHHLVLQDDILLCRGFYESLEKICFNFNNEILGIYSNRKICERAKEKNLRYVSISDGVWGQAILMPSHLVKKFLKWEKENIKESFVYDDTRVSIFAEENEINIVNPQPSLVQHLLPSNSTLGISNSKRVARWFEPKKDYRQFDWNNTKMIRSKTSKTSKKYNALIS